MRNHDPTLAIAAALVCAAPLLLAETVYELEEFVVRAWHFEKDVLEVPVDVTRIGREAIERSLAASVPDLLETEANLYFSSISEFTSVDIRGFGENSGLRTLVLVDGHPLNPGDMGRINWESIPLHSVETIEVLKGGHNVLYGDKALSGVIKIETRRSGARRLDIEGRLGSFGSSRGAISGTLGDESWSFRAGASRSQSDGYRENSASETRDAYMNVGCRFANGDDLDFRFSMGESELTYPGGLVYEDYRSDSRSSDKLGIEGSHNRFAALNGRADGIRDWGSWEVLAGYDYSKVDFALEPKRYGRNEQSGFSLKPRLKIGEEATTLIMGGDFLYDRLDFTALDESRSLVPSEAELDESRLSPYFLLERQLSKRLTVSGGARYEWVRYGVDAVSYDASQLSPVIVTNRGTFPNPNYKNPPDVIEEGTFGESVRQEDLAVELSANFRLNEEWSIFAGYDRVYRYPVFDERASYQGFPLAEDVNGSLDAEEGDNFEVGVKFIGHRHEVYLTAFLLEMENEIFFDPTVTGSNPSAMGLNVNLGPVDRYGADLLYRYDAGDWGISFQFAHVSTEMKAGVGKGGEVPLVPHWVTTSQLWWEPSDWLRLRALHRYVGERYEGSDFLNEKRTVEAYQLVDLSADVQVAPNCRVFVKVDNIFDELYADTAVLDVYYPGNGRSFELGVKLDF